MVNYSRQISDAVSRLPVSRLMEDDVLAGIPDEELAALDARLLARWNTASEADRAGIVAQRRAVNAEYCGRRS